MPSLDLDSRGYNPNNRIYSIKDLDPNVVLSHDETPPLPVIGHYNMPAPLYDQNAFSTLRDMDAQMFSYVMKRYGWIVHHVDYELRSLDIATGNVRYKSTEWKDVCTVSMVVLDTPENIYTLMGHKDLIVYKVSDAIHDVQDYGPRLGNTWSTWGNKYRDTPTGTWINRLLATQTVNCQKYSYTPTSEVVTSFNNPDERYYYLEVLLSMPIMETCWAKSINPFKLYGTSLVPCGIFPRVKDVYSMLRIIKHIDFMLEQGMIPPPVQKEYAENFQKYF
jgi:hypothetical protein